jgi:hypothetical protein
MALSRHLAFSFIKIKLHKNKNTKINLATIKYDIQILTINNYIIIYTSFNYTKAKLF